MSETTLRPESLHRRGRPPGTSRRELEVIALRLFAEHGFDGTTIEMIAAEAGTSRRTFFRYFDSKANVLWREFDVEVTKIGESLAAMPADLPVMEAIRCAVVAVNRQRVVDAAELRTRMTLIASTPELVASAAVHYDSWERAVTAFVARRRGIAADSLYPVAVGRATLAVCRAAYDQWVEHADADLTTYLDAALGALAAGFADDVLSAERRARRRPLR